MYILTEEHLHPKSISLETLEKDLSNIGKILSFPSNEDQTFLSKVWNTENGKNYIQYLNCEQAIRSIFLNRIVNIVAQYETSKALKNQLYEERNKFLEEYKEFSFLFKFNSIPVLVLNQEPFEKLFSNNKLGLEVTPNLIILNGQDSHSYYKLRLFFITEILSVLTRNNIFSTDSHVMVQNIREKLFLVLNCFPFALISNSLEQNCELLTGLSQENLRTKGFEKVVEFIKILTIAFDTNPKFTFHQLLLVGKLAKWVITQNSLESLAFSIYNFENRNYF